MGILPFFCPLGVWFNEDAEVLCHLGIFFLVHRLQEHYPKALVSVLHTQEKLSSAGARNNFLMAIRRRAQMFHHGAVLSHRHCGSPGCCPDSVPAPGLCSACLKMAFLHLFLFLKRFSLLRRLLSVVSYHLVSLMPRGGLGLSPGSVWVGETPVWRES